MSDDTIIVDGDKIQISIDSPAVVPGLTAPVALTATGFSEVNDKKVCIVGDELPPSLKSPMAYTAPPYVIPGMGTVSVTLKADNKTSVATDNDNKMLVKGPTFTAKFQVSSPAQQPSPSGSPVPDSTSSYSGTAQFITTNTVAESE